MYRWNCLDLSFALDNCDKTQPHLMLMKLVIYTIPFLLFFKFQQKIKIEIPRSSFTAHFKLNKVARKKENCVQLPQFKMFYAHQSCSERRITACGNLTVARAQRNFTQSQVWRNAKRSNNNNVAKPKREKTQAWPPQREMRERISRLKIIPSRVISLLPSFFPLLNENAKFTRN